MIIVGYWFAPNTNLEYPSDQGYRVDPNWESNGWVCHLFCHKMADPCLRSDRNQHDLLVAGYLCKTGFFVGECSCIDYWPNPRRRLGLPSVWMISTNLASLGSRRTIGSAFSKKGPAGSRPKYITHVEIDESEKDRKKRTSNTTEPDNSVSSIACDGSTQTVSNQMKVSGLRGMLIDHQVDQKSNVSANHLRISRRLRVWEIVGPTPISQNNVTVFLQSEATLN